MLPQTGTRYLMFASFSIFEMWLFGDDDISRHFHEYRATHFCQAFSPDDVAFVNETISLS